MLGTKGKTDWLPLIIVGAILLFVTGYITIPGQTGAVTNFGQQQQQQQEAVRCDSTTTPDYDLNTFDFYNTGTAIAEGESIYRKVGEVGWTQFTTGTAVTGLEPYTTYEYNIGTDATDFTDNAFGPYGTFTTGCQEVESEDILIYNDEIETSITATWYNADDTASTGEAFSANAPQTVYAKFEAGADEVYGNPFIATSGLTHNNGNRAQYPNLLALKLNSTGWDVPDRVYIESCNPKAGTAGTEMHRVGCPAGVSAATGYTFYCYEAPVIFDSGGVKFALSLNPDDSNAPMVDDTIYLYSSAIFLNSDTGELQAGNFNEDDAAVGADAADSLTADFTA